jgi:NAD(P)-dependent dehydrogenase (short-subunit alcohol dehydrogenase family)
MEAMMGRLDGKRALITGAGSGIGRAAAVRLAQLGASVAVVDLNLAVAEETAQTITAFDGSAIALKADVRVEAEVAEAMNQSARRFGGLDTIIANAGVMLMDEDKPVAELSLETWQRNLDVNLTGMFLTCKHGVRALLREGGGSVIITSSPTGQLGCAPGFTAYSSSKSGSFGLMRIMAVDYARSNIRVNAVLPGTTNSPLVRSLMEDEATRSTFMARIPMGRPGEPDEAARVMAFLASDDASYVTGAAWYVDGGLSSI